MLDQRDLPRADDLAMLFKRATSVVVHVGNMKAALDEPLIMVIVDALNEKAKACTPSSG